MEGTNLHVPFDCETVSGANIELIDCAEVQLIYGSNPGNLESRNQDLSDFVLYHRSTIWPIFKPHPTDGPICSTYQLLQLLRFITTKRPQKLQKWRKPHGKKFKCLSRFTGRFSIVVHVAFPGGFGTRDPLNQG